MDALMSPLLLVAGPVLFLLLGTVSLMNFKMFFM